MDEFGWFCIPGTCSGRKDGCSELHVLPALRERGPCPDSSPGDTGNSARPSGAVQGSFFFLHICNCSFFPFCLLLMLFVSSKIASV